MKVNTTAVYGLVLYAAVLASLVTHGKLDQFISPGQLRITQPQQVIDHEYSPVLIAARKIYRETTDPVERKYKRDLILDTYPNLDRSQLTPSLNNWMTNLTIRRNNGE